MSIQGYLQSIMERLQNSASVKTVCGEPVVAEGKTVIPVSKAGYGFCACAGQSIRNQQEGPTKENEPCGGGAVYARPIGIVEITKEDTKFIPISEGRRIAGALIIGLFLGLVISSRRSRK